MSIARLLKTLKNTRKRLNDKVRKNRIVERRIINGVVPNKGNPSKKKSTRQSVQTTEDGGQSIGDIGTLPEEDTSEEEGGS